MIVGGGGTSFDYPAGDPGPIDAAAGQLRAIAGQLQSASSQVTGAASAAASSWSGLAASQFEVAVSSVRSGLAVLAGDHSDAAAALSTYASALQEAQQAASRAAQGYAQAQQAFEGGMSNLRSSPPTGPDAQSQLSAAETRLADNLDVAYRGAAGACSHACGDAMRAAEVCAAKLGQIAADLKDTSLHKFLDLIAGPGALLGVFGSEQQGQAAVKLWSIIASRAQAERTMLQAVQANGETSYEALTSWYRFLEAHPDDEIPGALNEFYQAAVPVGEVPGGAAGILDIVGKGSLVLGVAADVGTLADGRATGLDKAMSGANLAGIGMVASGMDIVGGTSLLATIGATDTVAAAIPIAGEVVIAGTALFLAGEWAYNNWGTIEHWGSDIGHTASSVVHGAEHLLSDLNPF